MLRCLGLLLAIGYGTVGSPHALWAQTTPPPATAAVGTPAPPHPDSVAAMLPYAKAYASLQALRERADAEYAEQKNKKPEVLAELRAKYRGERARLLQGQGLTEASYMALTQRVSGDDRARAAFEAALAKQSAK